MSLVKPPKCGRFQARFWSRIKEIMPSEARLKKIEVIERTSESKYGICCPAKQGKTKIRGLWGGGTEPPQNVDVFQHAERGEAEKIWRFWRALLIQNIEKVAKRSEAKKF